MAEGLEKTPQQSVAETIEHLKLWELEITRFRDVNLATIHPWALNPLANAIGSVQNAISHLQSVKHHIETPNPPIDAEFQVIKDY